MSDLPPQVHIEKQQVGPDGIGVQVNLPALLPLPPAQVFPSNLDLRAICIGRDEEIAALRTALIDQVGSVALIALQGMGGIGKTRLALEFIRRHQQDFPGGIFWLKAEDESQRENEFYNILCLLEPHTPNIANLRANKRDIGAMLSQAVARYQPGQHRLWVLDNVPETNATQRATSLKPWRPVTDNKTSLLITSRRTILESGLESIEVQPLGEEAAVQLLTQRCKGCSPDDLAQAREIAHWVGYLPLALELISYSIPTPWTLNRWHQLISKDAPPEVDRILTDLRHRIPEDMLGIVQVFLKSYELLTAEAQSLARTLAHFGPDPIPKALIDALGESAPPLELDLLQSRYFLSGASDGFVGSMHRLLGDFLRHNAGAEAERDRVAARDTLIAAMPWDLCSDPRQHYKINPIRQHALSWLQRKNSLEIDDVNLNAHTAQSFCCQGEFSFAFKMQKQTLEVRKRVLGNDHHDTLIAMGNLALTLYSMGDLVEARRYEEQTLIGLKRVLGDNDPKTLTAMNNLAMTLYAMGDLVEARRYQEQTLAVSKHMLGDDHADTLRSMNNLAGTLREMGNLVEALRYQEQTFAISKRVLGDDHPDTLTSMNNLAVTLYTMGDTVTSRRYQEQILEVRKRVLGDNHPDTLTAMNNIALTLYSLGDLVEALRYQEQTLARSKRVLGDDHSFTLTTMNNLAHILFKMNNAQDALKLAQKILISRHNKLGIDHPKTKKIQTFVNLITKTQLKGKRSLKRKK
jgi:tetratricopeptide (TPR) repeat protein